MSSVQSSLSVYDIWVLCVNVHLALFPFVFLTVSFLVWLVMSFYVWEFSWFGHLFRFVLLLVLCIVPVSLHFVHLICLGLDCVMDSGEHCGIGSMDVKYFPNLSTYVPIFPLPLPTVNSHLG